MKILSSFIHSNVIPNLYAWLSSVQYKKWIFCNISKYNENWAIVLCEYCFLLKIWTSILGLLDMLKRN